MSEQEDNEQALCKACKQNAPEPTHVFPLCQQCRQLLTNRPYPKWIKVMVVLVALLMVYSAAKFPTSIAAGTAQRAGKVAEAGADYAAAVLYYQKVLSLFPASEEHKARLAICYIKIGEVLKAREIVKNLNEKSLSKSVVAELNSTIQSLPKLHSSN